VVIQRLIRDTYTPNAQALFSSVTRNDALIVPEFCLLECTNVIWKQMRFYGMTTTNAAQIVKDLRALPLKRTAVKRLLYPALTEKTLPEAPTFRAGEESAVAFLNPQMGALQVVRVQHPALLCYNYGQGQGTLLKSQRL
jgi:hypothetical protein